MVHRSVRGADVESAAVRRRARTRRWFRRSRMRSGRWRWSRRVISRALRRHADTTVVTRGSVTRCSRIDAHQHFWRYTAAEYGWIDDSMAALRRDFLPAELRREMDGAAIDVCVAVQARQTLEETRWLLELADAQSVHRRRHWLGRSAGGRCGGAAGAIRESHRNWLASATSCRESPTIASCCGRRSAAASRCSKIAISPTTSSSTRSTCPPQSSWSRDFRASASCSIIWRSRDIRARRDTGMGKRDARARESFRWCSANCQGSSPKRTGRIGRRRHPAVSRRRIRMLRRAAGSSPAPIGRCARVAADYARRSGSSTTT